MPNPKTCPVGLITECEMVERLPARRQEIIADAIHHRERELMMIREVRGSITMHPVHATRVALISGIVTYVLALFLILFDEIGHWYAMAKTTVVHVQVPLIGTQSFPVGGYVPTSTVLGVAAQAPSLSYSAAAYLALGVVAAILIQQAVVSILHVKQARELARGRDELIHELAVLKDWSSQG